jgi:hypothetical protein
MDYWRIALQFLCTVIGLFLIGLESVIRHLMAGKMLVPKGILILSGDGLPAELPGRATQKGVNSLSLLIVKEVVDRHDGKTMIAAILDGICLVLAMRTLRYRRCFRHGVPSLLTGRTV